MLLAGQADGLYDVVQLLQVIEYQLIREPSSAITGNRSEMRYWWTTGWEMLIAMFVRNT